MDKATLDKIGVGMILFPFVLVAIYVVVNQLLPPLGKLLD